MQDVEQVIFGLNRLRRLYSGRYVGIEHHSRKAFHEIPLIEIEKLLVTPSSFLMWSEHNEFSGMNIADLNKMRSEGDYKEAILEGGHYEYMFNPDIDGWCNENNYVYKFWQISFPLHFAVVEFEDDKHLVHFKMRWL